MPRRNFVLGDVGEGEARSADFDGGEVEEETRGRAGEDVMPLLTGDATVGCELPNAVAYREATRLAIVN